MEWIGYCIVIPLIFYSFSMHTDIKNLKKNIRKTKKNKGGNIYMSKMISDLIGKECLLSTNEYSELKCNILDVDEEWIKVCYINNDKKACKQIKIIRIDNIEDITLTVNEI